MRLKTYFAFFASIDTSPESESTIIQWSNQYKIVTTMKFLLSFCSLWMFFLALCRMHRIPVSWNEYNESTPIRNRLAKHMRFAGLFVCIFCLFDWCVHYFKLPNSLHYSKWCVNVFLSHQSIFPLWIKERRSRFYYDLMVHTTRLFIFAFTYCFVWIFRVLFKFFSLPFILMVCCVTAKLHHVIFQPIRFLVFECIICLLEGVFGFI